MGAVGVESELLKGVCRMTSGMDREPEHFGFVPVDRRRFLSGAIVGGAAALGGGLLGTRGAVGAWQAQAGMTPARKARNVIFMVADGMSLGTLSLADIVSRVERGAPTNWVKFNQRTGTRRALQNTSAVESLVTDSAAAASAWGSGRRVKLGSINVAPDGRQQMPVLVRAKQAGKMIGCVTTTRVTHATPAGFYANAPVRDLEEMIANDLLTRGVDVALGGGERFFSKATLDAHGDVRVVRTKDELLAAPLNGRLLGLFSRSHVPFSVEREAGVPGLVEMTKAALVRLEKGADGFVLQIEGGRVDHAAHNNDAVALMSEMLEFDDAVGAVLKWMDGRDDTLLIITTDHANANPGLTLYRGEGAEGLTRVRAGKHSFDWIEEQIKGMGSEARAAGLKDVIAHASGIELDDQSVMMVARTMQGERESAFREANKWTSVLGAALADHFAVAFLSPNHTADLVELNCTGPGSELIPSYIENHDVHDVVVSALGLPEAKPLDGMDVLMHQPAKVKAD